MKRKIFSIMFALVLICSLVLVVGPASAVNGPDEASASKGCTMAIVGKDLTADGSTMFFHNEELGGIKPIRLRIIPGGSHEPGQMVPCGHEMIPQVLETYTLIGTTYHEGCYPPAVNDWSMGMNERGVMVLCNAQSSKEDAIPLPEGTGVAYSDHTEVAMARAETAREALDTFTGLLDTYGIGGSWPSCCWIFADEDEVWYIETTNRHWVARLVGDDELLPISNRYNIGTQYDLASADLIEYAVAQGWYDPDSGDPFSWKDVYGRSSTQNSTRLIDRENRVKELLEPKWGQITLEDVFAVTRDHYEGTELECSPPHVRHSGRKPICSYSMQFGMVFQLRDWLPSEIGAVMWFQMLTPCTSVHVPVYAGVTSLPEVYSMGATAEIDPVSAYGRFWALEGNVDEDYANLSPHVRDAWYKFEERELKQVPGVEERALKAYQAGGIEKMNKILTAYTNTMLFEAYNKAKALNNWVLAQLAK